MKAFVIEEGLVMPLDRANVDTDFIIPKQFLKSIRRSGFGVNLFDEHRYLDKGEPGCGQQQAAAESRFRAQSATLPGRVNPYRAGQFRLRFQPRTRAMGAGRLWFSGCNRPKLC